MKETIDLLGKILKNILTALYEPSGFSLLLSFLAKINTPGSDPNVVNKVTQWGQALESWNKKEEKPSENFVKDL